MLHFLLPVPMIREQQCVVPLGNDRIENILTVSQCKSLKERWTINLKYDTMDGELVNRSRLPKKRLLQSFHLGGEESNFDGIKDEFARSNCSSVENNNSLVSEESRNHNLAQAANSVISKEPSSTAAKNAVTNFVNSTSNTSVAVVKPTITSTTPTLSEIETSSPVANSKIKLEKASERVSEVTDSSAPTLCQITLNRNDAKHLEDGGSPRVTMLNGKYFERNNAKNEDVDKVVIHKKRRRLSESPVERKCTPPEGSSEAKVTVSKRISTESNASSGEPRSGQSSGSNSPKNYSHFKRKKREPEDIINQREVVGTVSRICQELPRCNWLEEKILKTNAAVNSINCTASNKDLVEKLPTPTSINSTFRPNSSVSSAITSLGNNINSPNCSSSQQPAVAYTHAFTSYLQTTGSPNISRVLPVKKPHMSPIFIDSEPIKEIETGHQQMPELIADQQAIKKSTVHSPMTTSSRIEYLSDKEKRLSHENVTSPFSSNKPPSRSGSGNGSLNGSTSGLVSNYVESDARSPNYKYEYMSKNLTLRLNQMNPMGSVPEPIRHDLFELDRKRKFLLDEVESIQKKKMEELENVKRIEARKEGLMKELANTQEIIEKQKLFMKQLEKDIMTKSRAMPQLQQPQMPPNPQHARQPQHPQQLPHPHLLQQEFSQQHAGGVYPAAGHFPPHPAAAHHLSRQGGYHPPPAQSYPELVRHHPGHHSSRLMEAGGARPSQNYQGHVPPPAQAFGFASQPPQLQGHPRVVDPNKFAGFVPSASRHPQQNYSAAITRQPNAGWMANAEYNRARATSGDKSPNVVTSTANGPWKSVESATSTSNISKDPLKGMVTATACKNCRKEANFMCSACKSVHYCSLDCQKMHWLEHSKHCISKSQQQKPTQAS